MKTKTIIESFDAQVARLTAIRDFLASKQEALFGWESLGGMAISLDLVQFHRGDDPQKMELTEIDVDAKIIARAIGYDWKRVGNKWEGRMLGFPEVRLILHHAVSGHIEPEIVEL